MTSSTTRFVKLIVLSAMLCATLAFSIFSKAQEKGAYAQPETKKQIRIGLKVRQLFFAGFKGNEVALEKAMKTCEEALAVNPNDGEALVWHGSGLYYRSWQVYLRGEKERGLALRRAAQAVMDRAVEVAPDSVGVRIQRGSVALGVYRAGVITDPAEAKGLLARAIADYEKAYEVQKDTSFKDLGEHPRGELMLGLADAYSRVGELKKAKYWFTRIQTELKDTPYSESADTWLKNRKPLPTKLAGCFGCHTGNNSKPNLSMPVVPKTSE